MPKDPPLFDPGQIVATPAALALLKELGVSPADLITRHLSGDFGDVGMLGPDSLDEDPCNPHSDGLALNTLAVLSGEDRILSIYSLPNGDQVYLETASDRSNSTLYLPEEY